MSRVRLSGLLVLLTVATVPLQDNSGTFRAVVSY